MQITSSQSTSSSPSISRAPSPSPTLPASQETESNSEENQLSNQHIKGFVVDAGQTSNQSDIGSATRVGRDPQVDTISQQLEKTKDRIPSPLDAITTNLNRISGRLGQLEPKFLAIAIPVWITSLSFWLYATNTSPTFQGKPNHQSEPLLDNLLKQLNQFEQANDSMPNRLDFLEAELSRLSALLNQSNPHSSHPALSACVFSIFLCFCVISTLWKKLNSQSIQNKELEKQLIQLKNEKTDLAIEFSNQSEQTQILRNELNALHTRFHLKSENLPWTKLTGVPTTLRGFGIKDAITTEEFEAVFNSFHPKNGELAWPKITQTPTTLNGYGITDAAPIADPAFIGEPTAPTPDDEDNSQRVSTTAFVNKKLATVAPTGAIMFFASQTAPDGWLKANGTTIDNTLYQELDAVIYVGDADNATASFGYRCTDKDNPNNTRSTHGNFTVLPDLRGYFLRGLDLGAGRDPNRTLGSVQDSQNKAHAHAGSVSTEGNHVHTARADSQGHHTHSINDPGHSHGTEVPFGANGGGSMTVIGPYAVHGYYKTHHAHTGISINGDGAHSHKISIDSAGEHNHTITVASDGGNEARPSNIALLACIKH